ncbi:O-antigen ligase family protein [Geodermatophilus sp. SYSU D01176]
MRVGTQEPAGGVLAVIAGSVALIPLLVPKGPGHSAPIDVLIAASIFVAFLWALSTGARLHLPYVAPMTGLLVAGLAAALVGTHPMRGGIAVIQEILLLLWAAALATVCRTPRALRVVLRAWAISATAWGALLVLAVLLGWSAVSGASGGLGTRARLFFDHPNMAGNYFMIAVFVVVAAGRPRHRWARIGACAVLLAAMFFTGSNAALGSLVIGAVLALFLSLRIRLGLLKAIAVITAVVGVLGVGWIQVGAPLVQMAQHSDNPLLRYSLGRGERSAEARESLFQSQFELFESGSLLGVGPANTLNSLDSTAASAVKEAHNDYLATLVERGPVGALALAGLIGVIIVRCTRFTARPLSPPLARVLPVPAALAGACLAFAVTAVTHEVLHYRWFWTLLGLVAAAALLASADRAVPGAEPVPIRTGPGVAPPLGRAT